MNYINLIDVCKINMGQSPDSKSYNDNCDGIPFFQGNADFGERYPVTRVWCNAPTKIANPNDILISVRAPIGALNFARERCCIGRGLAAITPNTRKVSVEFIYWLLKGKTAELNGKGTGSTFKAINRKVLEETQVPDIPLEQQLDYAAVLEKIYALINYRKQQLSKLDELVKARFVEMFGDVATIHETWRKKKFGDVTINYDSARKPVKDTDRQKMQGEYPYYGATGIVDYVNDYMIEGTYLLVSEDGKALEFRNKDIAFIASGKIWVNNHAHVLQCTDDMNMLFLMKYMNYRTINDWITGIDQKKLNRANMDKIPVGVPPLDLQNQFAAFVRQVDKSKVAVQKALDEAQLLFDSLMQEYFG